MHALITRSFIFTLLFAITTSSFAIPGEGDDASDVDLVVTEVSTPDLVVPQESTFTISSTVKNEGKTASSDEISVKFYLSEDAEITSTDIEMDESLTVAELAAGESDSQETLLTVPESVLPGIYFVGVVVDGANQQPETNEANNSNSPSTTTITVVF